MRLHLALPETKRTSDRERIADLEARVAKLEAEKRKLEELARVDALTGLGNRRAFEQAFDSAVRFASRFNSKLSILLIDLDGMKRLNDEHGHPAGDQGLRAVGELLQAWLRGTDVSCRCGGDEFAVILPGTGQKGSKHVAEKLRRAIETLTIVVDGETLRPFTASIGIAVYGVHGASVEEMVQVADEALYQAKRAGKNRVADAIALPLPNTEAA